MRNKAERRGEEEKKFNEISSIRDFLRNEEINFKIPIESRTFRLVLYIVSTLSRIDFNGRFWARR